jgi:predicted ATPase
MQVLERDSVLDRLRLCLREAAGQGRLVLLAGEAGGGKTTVVRQLCESVSRGTRVMLGNCDPLSTPRPLGPLLDMASMLGRTVENLLAEAAPRDRALRLAVLAAEPLPGLVLR